MSEIRESLVTLLDDLIRNTGITSSCLITEDGLVIASNSEQSEQDEEVNVNFAAISASILSMAERGIEILNTNKNLEQIKIDAGFDSHVDEDFTIIITRVFSNVLLQVIFPKRINTGLIHYETNKIIRDIKNQMYEDSSREELFSSLGSLL
jgi:predicted regulator of Ras-like GTPase activity (Roadblock/LC7/MglB family)